MIRTARSAPITVVVLAMLALATTPASGGGPIVVRRTAADEQRGAGTTGYVAWQQDSEASDGRTSVFVRPRGERTFRVNSERSQAYMGGFDGTTLVYQRRRGQRSDIKLYDVETRTRFDPPAEINTNRWEYWPTLSGEHFLFGRLHEGRDRVILFDAEEGTTKILARGRRECCFLQPGQVNGRFAVWARWKPSTCNVFVYDISTETTTRIPNPRDRCNFAPSVARDGTVYYGRSNRDCGENSRLMRRDPDRTTQVLVDFAPGRDFGASYVLARSSANHVFFDPGPCGGDADIKKIVDPTG